MKISERLEYLTQIHKSWDNTEQRAALRTSPRRFISYDYIGTKGSQSQYLRALAYSKQTEKIEIPLWHANCQLDEILFKGQTNIKAGKDKIWPYRGMSGLLLWSSDELGGDRYPLKYILGDGTVISGNIFARDYPPGTIVCPVGWGVLQQESAYDTYSSMATSLQLNLELLPDYSITPVPDALDEYHYETFKTEDPWAKVLPTTYNSVELFTIPPSWTKDLSAKFTRNVNRMDNQSGVFKYDLKSLNPTETREIEYVAISRSEINNLQRFFCRCKGRLKSFYAPTWLSDMALQEDAPPGQNYLIVDWPLLWKYYANMNRRKTIVIFQRDYTATILKVAGYTTDDSGNYGKIFLDNQLTKAINKAEVLLISFLVRYRLDTDSMLVDYDTTDAGTTSLSFMEVNE